jgi:hypothetical protein
VSLSGKITTTINFNETLDPSTAERVKRDIDLAISNYALTDGTGAAQANKVWTKRQTLTATSATYDLAALALPNVAGSGTGSPLLAFTKIKLIALYNESTTDGAILYFGNAATNRFSAYTDTSAARLLCMPGIPLILASTLAQASNPWTVDATHKDIKIDSGAATITYTLIIAGV